MLFTSLLQNTKSELINFFRKYNFLLCQNIFNNYNTTLPFYYLIITPTFYTANIKLTTKHSHHPVYLLFHPQSKTCCHGYSLHKFQVPLLEYMILSVNSFHMNRGSHHSTAYRCKINNEFVFDIDEILMLTIMLYMNKS